MRNWLNTMGAAALAAAALLGDPGRLSMTPAPAAAQGQLVCSSYNFQYSYCPMYTGSGVQLYRQLSRSACIQGQSWGQDGRGVWVNNGCSASFVPRGSGGGGGDVGAAVVGGIFGAILGAAISSGNNNHRYYSNNSNNYQPPYYGNSYNPEPGWVAQQRARDYAAQAQDANQRSAYLANQNNRLDIQASQDRQDRDNAQAARDDANAAAERARGEADELAQAKDAEVAAARDAQQQQDQIRQGEDDENRQAAEAEAGAGEETPQ